MLLFVSLFIYGSLFAKNDSSKVLGVETDKTEGSFVSRESRLKQLEQLTKTVDSGVIKKQLEELKR